MAPIIPQSCGLSQDSVAAAPLLPPLHTVYTSTSIFNHAEWVASARLGPQNPRHMFPANFPALDLSIGLPALESCTRSLDAHLTRVTAARQAVRFFPLRLSALRFNPAFAQRIRVRRWIARCFYAFRSILHCFGCSAPVPRCGLCLTGPPPSIAARFSRPVRCTHPPALPARARIQ